MPRKTTMRDARETAEAIGRNTFRVFFHPEVDTRPVEKRPIMMADMEDPKYGSSPKSKTPSVPAYWHKAYGAYAPRYTNGKKVGKKKTGKRKRGSK